MALNSPTDPDLETKLRKYQRSESAVVYKTKEKFGDLSNMAAGFPLLIGDIRVPTSEALYQACRFPRLPEVQEKIIAQKSPMTAKMVSKPYRDQTRADWDHVRVRIMRWCLRSKLAQHWRKFGRALLETGERPIVEESRRDAFWGAKVSEFDPSLLVGENVLGRLLMELRQQLLSGDAHTLRSVEPLKISDFLLCGKAIPAFHKESIEAVPDQRELEVSRSRTPSMHANVQQRELHMQSPFQSRKPVVEANEYLRVPQREAYAAVQKWAVESSEQREVGIVLPVGCGKSGCIALAPFAAKSRRTLVVAPGLHIAQQLASDFNPSNSEMFYRKCRVLLDEPWPEPVEIRGTTTNIADVKDSDVVITNVQQLQGDANRWLDSLGSDFFDLILFDEGHHSVAESWKALKEHFPNARIINFSATPLRADGQLMAGKVIYSYPIAEAIRQGYVKRLKAVQLNPRTLRYVRRDDGKEIEVGLEEVRKLGEQEADFRRSIVTSAETLNTIVDASIREVERLRRHTGERRLKIIASALNFEHCRQIVEAYSARSLRSAYVHSLEDGAANARNMKKLANHDLDVIVQVRKLGEGFDHPYLSVAAVFSIFSNLSPFVQFVGRIMRVIEQRAPNHPTNQGTVIFHAGANVARQWSDFQQYSEVDQQYFDELLPLEGLDPSDPAFDRELFPGFRAERFVEVRSQSEVQLEEIHLLRADEAAAIKLLQARGIIHGDFDPTKQKLEPVPVTRVAQRQALRAGLDFRVKTEAARILHERGASVAGHELDRQRLGRENIVVLKAAIDRKINEVVGRKSGERHELSRAELDEIDAKFEQLVLSAEQETFNEH